MQLQPTQRPIGVFKAINMVPTFTGGEKAAAALAVGCDVISATPHQLAPYIAVMRAANPLVCLLAYVNGTFSFDTTLPEELYLHDAAGGRVHSMNYPGNWCMDPGSGAWLSTLIAKCEAAVGDDPDAAANYDGVMLDMLGPYPVEPGYLSGVPFDPRTNLAYTAADWCADTSALGAAVKNALRNRGLDVVGNGLVDGEKMLAQPSTTVILDGIDGGLAEGWMPLHRGQNAQLFTEAIEALELDPGKFLFPMVKPWRAPTLEAADAAHRFSLAAYLLVASEWTFYSYAATSSESGVQALSPYEYTPIGPPEEPGHVYPDGHWSRRFRDGWSIVNPTSAAVTVTIGTPTRTFVDLDGRDVPDSFTMGPWSSTILHAQPVTAEAAPPAGG